MKINEKGLEALKTKVLNEIGRTIVLKAKKLAPFDQGILAKNIVWEVEGDTVTIHTQGVPYADKMEYGSPPMMLSEGEKQAVREWRERKARGSSGVPPSWAVIKKLEKKGIEVGTPEHPQINPDGRTSRPFLRPALHQSMAEIDNILKEALG